MRRTATLLLICLIGLQAKAQSWCPPGAEWISKPTVGWPVEGYTRVYYAGDTVLDGITGQRLAEQHAEQAWGSQDIFYYLHPAAMITASSNGVVFIWSTQVETWDTLFWFLAEPGDRWQRAHDVPIVGNPSDWIEVIDTTTIIVDGVPLRQLTVEQVCDGTWVNWGGTITERLGYWTPFYFPAACSTESGIFELRCYSDNEIDFAYGLPCDLFLSVTTNQDPGLEPFPNPGSSNFTLSLPMGSYTIALFDATGRRVYEQRCGGGPTSIPTAHLFRGMYVVLVTDVNDRMQRMKWSKE
ncbi:MAG: T9SS type A sorting domain-containing protein [Flavobacteriales bacterium]|nr:T9SS type A sorting domain-containing protein [Flavobacteriales bacterium]